MKKGTLSLSMVVLVVCSLLIFQACASGTAAKKKTTPTVTPGIQSAVKNSFTEVTAKLDKGANFYLYVNTENMIKGFDKLALQIRGFLAGAPMKSNEAQWGLKLFDLLYNLYKKTGLNRISGIGVSSISMDETINHTKIVTHHYKENNSGLIWQLHDTPPHALNSLKLLPADTVLTAFSDNNLKGLWEWIKKEAPQTGFPEIKDAVAKVEPGLLALGVDLPRILDSMSGPWGYLLTMDEKNMKTIPLKKHFSLEIPDPGLVIVISVKDDYLFNYLRGKMPFAKSVNGAYPRLEIPVPPMPVSLKPTIALVNGRLIIASNGKLVDDMLKAEKEGNGLTATEEFKRFSRRMPDKGNGFSYSSLRGSLIFSGLFKKVGEAAPKKGKRGQEIQKFIAELMPKGVGLYSVKQNMEDGNLTVINHNTGVEYIMMAPVLVTGIVAAIAVPNFLTAMQKGKQKQTMGDMKSVSIAVGNYIQDRKQAPTGSIEEIKKQLEPFYIKNLPIRDAWGNKFHYKHGGKKDKTNYSLASGGKNGYFKGWEQQGSYKVRSMRDFDRDIIISNGKFTFGPGVGAKRK